MDRMVSVTIPSDSGRRMTAFLNPTATPFSKWIFRDMSFRLAWRREVSSRVYTHDDMVKLGVEWIYDVVWTR